MRLALVSADGSRRNTRVIGLDGGLDYDSLSGSNPIDNVVGFTLERAYDSDARPLPYMLLNVTVRIDDGPETQGPDSATRASPRPLDMTA